MCAKKLVIQAKSLHGDDGYKVFSVRAKNDTFQKIEHVCSKSGYNRNEVATILIEYALENMIIEERDK